MAELSRAVVARCTRCGALNRVPRERRHDHPICGRCKARLFADQPVVANDQTFRREVEESPVPVLVDFWAPWCGPCRMMGPVLEELAREQAGRLKVVKVNVDENQASAARFRVQSIPTLMLWRDGEPADVIQGAVPKPELLRRLGPYLA